jgi:hypothetical protein
MVSYDVGVHAVCGAAGAVACAKVCTIFGVRRASCGVWQEIVRHVTYNVLFIGPRQGSYNRQ